MNREKLLIYLNPDFIFKFKNGLNILYQTFCRDGNYSVEIISSDELAFLEQETGHSRKLVIVGGDGTIHHVINTIPDSVLNEYVFGIIPAGTANEFAKSLKIPVNLRKSAELIMHGNQNFQHIGLINEKYKFATGLLYGVAAKVLQITPLLAKQLLGNNAFCLGFIKYLIQYWEAFKIKKRKFLINNQSFTTNYLLINNASLISKELPVNDIILEDKSKFSVVYLHSYLTVMQIFYLLFKYHAHYNILGEKAIAWKQIDEIILEFEGQTQFLLDGEPYKFSSPLTICHCKQPMAIITG
jgi:diacylglycerol kinase family enzyme